MVDTRITRRRTLLATLTGVTAGIAGCTGRSGSASPTTVSDDFPFESTAFDDGGDVPAQYTCDGIDASPPLSLSDVPEGTETLAVVVDDPDADVSGAFTHWVLWNVPADVGTIEADVPKTRTVDRLGGARQGRTSFGSDDIGYSGPCPPEGDGPHTYRFTAYAVSTTLSLDPGANKAALLDALDGVTVGRSRFTGEYER